MPILPFLSLKGGSGRTFLAANLGPVLAGLTGKTVLLAELCRPEQSELALHLGLDHAVRFNTGLDKGLKTSLPRLPKQQVWLANLAPEENPVPDLSAASKHFDWVLVDGLDTQKGEWENILEFCGHGILVEKGDLAGARRTELLTQALDAAHFPRQGFLMAWNLADPSQPLPEFQGLAAIQVPFYPKAVQRLAQGVLPCLVEPSHPFSKAIQALARQVVPMKPMTRRIPAEPKSALSGRPARADEKTNSAAGLPEANASAASPSQRTDLVRRVLAGVLESLNLKRVSLAELTTPNFRETWTPRVRSAASAQLALEDPPWLTRDERAALEQELVSHVLGYGPLDNALADETITEIMVNHKDQVFLERKGRLSLSNIRFWDNAQLLSVIERIVAPLGRRIDESSPKVDARLPDGSRVNAIIPPLALRGPCLTIRKFPTRRLTLDDLVTLASLTPRAAEFLKAAVLMRKNVVVSGGTGSGKTTLLNVLSSFIPEGERIVTVEDSAELRLDQEHVVPLESRPANLEGRGAVTIRDLVANCLRMRPDRIVVGECRGGEALDMLQAMNTGHEGSLTTVHANSPRDCLARLETLCLMSDVELPLRVVRGQIASAVDLIVQAARLKDGSRKIVAITEVLGMEGETVVAQDLFVFKQEGMDPAGRVLGRLQPTGVVARFFHQAREQGTEVDMGVFA